MIDTHEILTDAEGDSKGMEPGPVVNEGGDLQVHSDDDRSKEGGPGLPLACSAPTVAVGVQGGQAAHHHHKDHH